jgi:hypothetical protein
MQRLRCAATVLTLAAATAQTGPSQPPACDTYLHAPANDPYGYRARGDRCEGVYIKDLSASLRVVSFTREFDDFAEGVPVLRLEWAASSSREIHLHANGLRPRLYYAMDSIRPAGSSGYDWETSLLAALRITRAELGVVAWTSQRIGGQDRQVYLPVAVKGSDSRKTTGYRIIVISGKELRELYVSLSSVNTNGTRGAFLRKEEPLKAGYYPAEEPIEIPVPQLKGPGLYLLELGAEFQGGGVSTETLWFRYGE